ncbi:alpha-amylase [Pedobacter sp. JY14-1]|uniref:alpha-amylase n=1 Tax=Pedobacter sp. JY14-1 TaxID=3034151 RepID=UPI0023E34FB4|nr:alpha-amylase [Pedobacter sp. JY14-1]
MENFTMMQYFEWYCPNDGSLWKKFARDAERLKKSGIDSVWLPPAHKGMDGVDSTGYDSYDLYDLGEFDQKGTIRTKYGTKDEFIQAIAAGKAAGLQVYVDIVLNHLGGADEPEPVQVRKVNPDNRNEFISEPYEIEAYTKFTYPGRNGKYSEFKWDFQCFTGVDFDNRTGESAIYSIQNQYGEGWDEVLDQENGNYDYLMLADIEFRNPAVREELKRWGLWYYNTAKFDGFRLDAIKHMPAGFYNEWLDFLRAELNQELYTVGEYWSPGNLQGLLDYIDATGGRISLFDACLQGNFSRASKEGEQFDLSTILQGSLVEARPELAVTLVENHDTQPLQSLEQTVEPWFRAHAYAIILLREAGYPCVFFADVYGSCYTDKGDDGFDHEVTLEPLPQLEALLALRKQKAYGEQRDYFDHPSCIGWTRAGDDEHERSGLAVVLSNGEAGQKAMEIGSAFAGRKFVDALGHAQGEVVINETGWGDFYCEAGSVSVWTAVD